MRPIHEKSRKGHGTLVMSFFAASLAVSVLPPVLFAGETTDSPESALPYAIVLEQKTVEDPGWKNVAAALQKKRGATLVFWKSGEDLSAPRQTLQKFSPRYVCFLARPDELSQEGKVKAQTEGGISFEMPLQGVYYHAVHQLVTSLNDDPYDDAQWGVLTGATPDDALRVIEAPPLLVRRGLSHVGSGWLDKLESGVSFSECVQGDKWIKEPGKPQEKIPGPADTTEQFIAALNAGDVDMISTSGHATEHDWQMGYSYKSGMILPLACLQRLRPGFAGIGASTSPENALPWSLYGLDSLGHPYPITARNPKIYYSPGNCLIAKAEGPPSMIFGWIHQGVAQFSGHVGVQSRSCYAWGVAEYFLSLQDRFSFAEAVWLNRQAMRFALFHGKHTEEEYMCCRDETMYYDENRRRFLWETTTFYGDPAWEARIKPVVPPLYDQELQVKPEDGGEVLTFRVKMRQAVLPSRPAAFFLPPRKRTDVEVREGPHDLLVTDRVALVPFWKDGDPAPKSGMEFTASVTVKNGR